VVNHLKSCQEVGKQILFGFYSRVLTGLHGFFQRINWTWFPGWHWFFPKYRIFLSGDQVSGSGAVVQGIGVFVFIGLRSSTITVQICKTLNGHGTYFDQAMFNFDQR
jgi:hypothetical protein